MTVGDAAFPVQVDHEIPASGLHVCDVWCTFADPVEVFDAEVHPGFVGDGQQMEHDISRATHRYSDCNPIFECFLCQDVPRPYPLLKQPHHGSTGFVRLLQYPFFHRRFRRRPRGSAMPMASMVEDMVLAVNIPRTTPPPGTPHTRCPSNRSR